MIAFPSDRGYQSSAMRAWLPLPALLLVACGGAQKPVVCHASDACKEGEACVTGACVPYSAPNTVAPSMRKLTLEPEAVAFVLSEDEDGHPAVAPLGASVGPRARILLKFPKPTFQESIARAFLVLERAEGAQAGPGEVTLRAQQIVEPWSLKGGAGTTWASAPRAESITSGEVKVSARGVGAIRIDVTKWMADYAKKSGQSWGLRVEGDGEGYGVPIATGWAKGNPPRLEVYLQ